MASAAVRPKPDSREVLSANVLVAAVVLLLLVRRQLQPRRVRNIRGVIVLVVLTAYGTLAVIFFAYGHEVSPGAWRLLLLGLACGAGLGVVRANRTRIWVDSGVVWRQGGAVTVALWAVSIGVHLGLDLLSDSLDGSARGLGLASLPLFVAVSAAAQRQVTLTEARRLARPSPTLQTGASCQDG